MDLQVKVGKVGGVEDVELSEPVSPIGQYLNSSVLSIHIIGVLEFDNPIDDASRLALYIIDVFLPINHRFSSIMVTFLLLNFATFQLEVLGYHLDFLFHVHMRCMGYVVL